MIIVFSNRHHFILSVSGISDGSGWVLTSTLGFWKWNCMAIEQKLCTIDFFHSINYFSQNLISFWSGAQQRRCHKSSQNQQIGKNVLLGGEKFRIISHWKPWYRYWIHISMKSMFRVLVHCIITSIWDYLLKRRSFPMHLNFVFDLTIHLHTYLQHTHR